MLKLTLIIVDLLRSQVELYLITVKKGPKGRMQESNSRNIGRPELWFYGRSRIARAMILGPDVTVTVVDSPVQLEW